MGFGDFVDKAKSAMQNEKVQDALQSEKAGAALDGAAEKANDLTGGRFSDQIDSAKEAAGQYVGGADEQPGQGEGRGGGPGEGRGGGPGEGRGGAPGEGRGGGPGEGRGGGP
ncbi:Rv0909 family putative TA system antitoxin, partial [Georgenia alba]